MKRETLDIATGIAGDSLENQHSLRVSETRAAMFEAEATAEQLLFAGEMKTGITAEDAGRSREAELVTATLAGNQDSFARLYDLYGPMVHGILLARVPRLEVEDLVQDIFLHAFRKLHTLRNHAAFGAWIGMIARNRAMDYHRRARETVEIREDHARDDRPRRNRAHEILEVIRNLPEAYRETLILRLVEGMTGPEIASQTGLTPASVRVNLHRGMKLLRERLGLREKL
jgi:RNA polymerase sigma-70 factor, ECF subfamily